MKRIVAYLRVSTEDQHLGPEAQRAQIEAWAKRTRHEVASWHLDKGVSGASDVPDRPGLIAALADVKTLGCSLVIAKRDRLARDTMIAAMIDRAVAKLGGEVISADGSGNGNSPTDVLLRNILDAVAAFERSQIRARTKAALAVKRARGECTGHVPFGYARVGDKLVLAPDEQAQITNIRYSHSIGYSLTNISKMFNNTRTGNPMTASQIRKIIS